MYRWRLHEPSHRLEEGQTRRTVHLELHVTGQSELAELRWAGDQELSAFAEAWLLMSHGYGGYKMERRTTPVDVSCAMRDPRMTKFEPELIEGTITTAK